MDPITLALAGGSLLSGIGSLFSSNKASKTAEASAKASQVDIDALDAKTRAIAKQNALDAAALEQQLTPEVPQLRSQSLQGVIAGLTPSGQEQGISDYLYGNLDKNVGDRVTAQQAISPLLKAAIQRAQSELAMGGKLDADTANAVTRSALAKTGTMTGGLGLGRDVVARDLGLTSMGLANQRLANAASIGGQELGMNQFNTNQNMAAQEANNTLAFNNAANILNRIQLLRSISDSGFNRQMSAAGLGQSIAQPTVGLDPGSVASAVTGNTANASAALSNKANIYGQQSQGLMNTAGNLAGYGMLSYMNKAPSTTYPSTSNAAFYGLPTR